MTIKEFIKEVEELFGKVEFKATSKEGKIFRSTGYAKIESDIKRGRGTRKKANW